MLRDSAGVTIAEHTPSQVADLPVTVLDTPQLSIGALDGDTAQQLYGVRGVTRLSDGRLAVLNGGSHSIRFYDADGELVHSVGRQGRGPGEFVFPVSMQWLRGDTIVIFDHILARFTFIGPGGEIDWMITPTQQVGGPLPLDSVRAVLVEPVHETGRTAAQTETSYIARIEDLQSGNADTIGLVGISQSLSLNLSTRQGEMAYVVSVPYRFGYNIRTHDGEVHVLDAVAGEVRVYDGDARLTRISRFNAPPRPVNREEFDRFVDRHVARARDSEGAPQQGPTADQIRRMYRDMPLPESAPFFGGLLVARNGDVWLRDFTLSPAEFSSWTVLASGRPIARIRTPRGFALHEAGEDYVLGVSHDDLGVPYVHLYRLPRR